jgi:hypothetical protein
MTLMNDISNCMTGSSLFRFYWKSRSGLLDRGREGVPKITTIPQMVFIRPFEMGRSTCQSASVFLSEWETVFTPKTEFGRKLYALRTKAVVAGMKLLSEDEVFKEVKRRRGEIDENEKDLY